MDNTIHQKLRPQITLVEDNQAILKEIAKSIEEDSIVAQFPRAVINRFSTKAEVEELFSKGLGYGVFVVDIRLGEDTDRDGLKIITRIKKENPSAKVIALTGYIDEEAAAKKAGADEFLVKGSSSRKLLKNIHRINEIIDQNWHIKKTEYQTLVDEMEEHFVYLYCFIGMNEEGNRVHVKTRFPRIPFFGTVGDLFIGKPILLTITEIEGYLIYYVTDAKDSVDPTLFVEEYLIPDEPTINRRIL